MDRKIRYMGCIDWCGAHYVQFQIEGVCYAYQLSFPDWCESIETIARKYSAWKALKKAKKLASTWFRTHPDWPDNSAVLDVPPEETQ